MHGTHLAKGTYKAHRAHKSLRTWIKYRKTEMKAEKKSAIKITQHLKEMLEYGYKTKEY